jgi:pantoate--beta-alanine ligase
MKVAKTVSELRSFLAGYDRPSFVPTMGNLHDGHMALVRLARAQGDVTVSSIFVNRLQFGPSEDFGSYPRTLEADLHSLERNGCDVVFAPMETELYSQSQTYLIQPDPSLADTLEGRCRPGFFTGVCTVVMKLLGCVQPKVAVFGEKDYQQLLVVSKMVSQFCLDVEIVPAPIQRCPDGLAYSSRNSYLSNEEREEAPRLYVILQDVVRQARQDGADFARIEQQACEALVAHGWKPDYVAIRDTATLLAPGRHGELSVLAAARLGTTRLIDNLRFGTA